MADRLAGLEMLANSRNTADDERKPTQAQLLLLLAEEAELFHDEDGVGYARIPVAGHLETWPVGSRPFRGWLQQRFFADQGKPAGRQAEQDAIELLRARALFDGPTRPVYTRLAEAAGQVVLDLCDEAWRAVLITPHGWQVVQQAPVAFRRTSGMRPLPEPVPGGSLDELREFVNVPDETSWRLLVAWLVAALRPRGPYPVLLLQGEQGSAKSTTARVLRALVDPSKAPVRTMPRDERDLMIAANNGWVIVLDNLSGVPNWLSDAICRLSTGGGFATRTLYSDDEETIFEATRPVILNGIDDLASRHDLLDRSLILTLPVIPEDRRQPEEVFWRRFEAARPCILGALLNAVAAGLRNLPHTRLARLPRMADFAQWVCACEEALPWEPGGFMAAYTTNRTEAIELAVEADLVAAAVRRLLEQGRTWEGQASDLLEALEAVAGEQVTRSKSWPKSARALSNRLQRAAPHLRAMGIEVERYREANTGRRMIALRPRSESTVTTVTTVTGSPGSQAWQGFEPVTQTVMIRDATDDDAHFASRGEPAEDKRSDDRDASDETKRPLPDCPTCGGRSWWRSLSGKWTCSRCHPPALPDLVADKVEG